MPGHICVERETFAKLPEAGPMTIRGRTSAIGTHMVAVEPIAIGELSYSNRAHSD
jgi:hypothetical protein